MHLVSKAFTAIKEGGCDKRLAELVIRDLYSLNLLAKLMMLHHHILFSLAIAAITEQS